MRPGGIEIQNDDSQDEILELLQTPEEARQQVEDLLEDARRRELERYQRQMHEYHAQTDEMV